MNPPPALWRAKNKRHHIIFGRRGSGKSSLLAKVTEDLTVNRTPIAYVDLEEFKGHSYPDVLLSVLIKALAEFKNWLQTAALSPANKTSFWTRFFGAKPKRGAFNKANTQKLAADIGELIDELNKALFESDEAKTQTVIKHESADELHTAISSGVDSKLVPVTLEKYDLTKRFLLKILENFARESELQLDEFLTDGARDRLVLASGGVARDFLTIFRRALDFARERIARGEMARGEKIGAEDVNRAAGENDKFKREDFSRDAGRDEQGRLMGTFEQVSEFCLNKAKANCFLVDKDLSGHEVANIAELVDLKFLHHVKSRVTVRDRQYRLYDAYMLDLSQYAGERARQNFEIVEFWGRDADDSLRRTRFIYIERSESARPRKD